MRTFAEIEEEYNRAREKLIHEIHCADNGPQQFNFCGGALFYVWALDAMVDWLVAYLHLAEASKRVEPLEMDRSIKQMIGALKSHSEFFLKKYKLSK